MNFFIYLLSFILIILVNGKEHKAGEGVTRKLQVSTNECPNICFNGNNCNLDVCQDCFFACSIDTCRIRQTTCKTWCYTTEDCTKTQCSGCTYCNNSVESCPITTFEDKTSSILDSDLKFGLEWLHTGKPYFNDGSPVLFDMNGDNVLDYFNSMHGAPLPKEFSNRMELGIGMMINNTEFNLQNVSERIVCIDEPTCDGVNVDAHGSVVVDLDGDGNLDIFISNGGNKGEGLPEFESNLDNWLFWGELELNEESGKSVTVFSGGRSAARDANVEMQYGRGRFNYLFDANGDGLLDIFSSHDSRVDNEILPGILLINQGDRTWKEDPGMKEFSRTMMVTDADGDGIAQEFILNRSFCYPQRNGPGVDPSKPELGKFSDDVKRFCHTRPVGTNAVYRFNHETNQMDLISKEYRNFWAGSSYTQPCCTHESWPGGNDCNALSMVSGDFDNDLKADHVFLYSSKLVFFFSTDRESGQMPDNAKYIGLEIALPSYCQSARSVQIVDFDNDGKEELLISCLNVGTYLLYSRGVDKKDWKLQNGCNGKDALGDLNNRFLAMPTDEELIEFCGKVHSDTNLFWDTAEYVCEDYERTNRISNTKSDGMTIVDINNDGFKDIITTNSFGHVRFFYNTPSPVNSNNKFISFRLVGDLKTNINYYAVGTTLILESMDSKSNGIVRQFREFSSIQHHNDIYSGKDDRIIFGLGQNLIPNRIIVRWPSGFIQHLQVDAWEFTNHLEPIDIRNTQCKYL